jgi:multiple sugar transport system permease protein
MTSTVGVKDLSVDARELPRRARRRSTDWLRGEAVFLLPAALYLAVLVFYPFVALLQMSVSKVTADNIFKTWTFVGLAEFQTVTATPAFREALLNTLVYVAIVVVVGMAGGLFAAVVVWKERGFLSFVLGLMVFVWAMPPIVTGSVWKFLLAEHGPINSLLPLLGLPTVLWLIAGRLPLISVAFVCSWAAVPFATIVYRAALLDIPPELLDAAKVDGASPSEALWRVVLPMLRPTTLVLGTLMTMYAFRSFDYIYVMTYGGPGTVSTTLPFLGYRLAFVSFQFSQGAATAVVSVAIVSLLALVYIRQVQAE